MDTSSSTHSLSSSSSLDPLSSPRPIDPKQRVDGDGQSGTLWVIAVPIGNLEDITLRAIRLLEKMDVIACEDTRTTRQLFQLLNLTAPTLIACHEHNEAEQVQRITHLLEEGKDVGLVSDAGTPNISDPGYRLISAIQTAGFAISPLPGPCAAIAALSVSGLPTNRFRFIGFLSSKGSGRRKALETFKSDSDTLIFYESPYRLNDFLTDACQILGGHRRGVVAREVTKRFEEFRRGTLDQLTQSPGKNRGEIVILIEGQSAQEQADLLDLDSLVQEVLSLGLPPSKAAKVLSKRSYLTRQQAYDLLQKK
jgi:16S rRNA (cytidine1402-2'-O)-methyltransferase